MTQSKMESHLAPITPEAQAAHDNSHWDEYAHLRLAGFDPNKQNYRRYRFECTADDNRPIVFPPPGPWWETGVGFGYTTIVAYLPYPFEVKDFWPEVHDSQISFAEHCETITYTDRFSKPSWWPF